MINGNVMIKVGFPTTDIDTFFANSTKRYTTWWLVTQETQNGYCEFDEGGTCTEDSLFTAVISVSYTTILYNWTVTGATMENTNGDDYCVVSTPLGDTDVDYTIRLDVIIDGIPNYIEGVFTHVKTLAPINILAISEDSSGSCTPV